MADFLDELIGIKKEFQAITKDISADTAELRGSTVTAEPVWSPGDYKVVPKGNVAMCVRCKREDASCNLCMEVCPTHSIYLDDDGSIEIKADCRKCSLCVAACPTDAIVSSMHGPKMVYDKICRAATAFEMAYVTCTRALGHCPHEAEVVVPCVGAISPEVWYSILCEFGNVGVYLPRGICDKCRNTTGESCYVDAIGTAEGWANETVDLVERERDLVLENDHQVERQEFVSSTMKSVGMTAAKVNPLTNKLAQATEAIASHSKQIAELQKSLDRMCGAKNVEEKKRILTNTRQLMLVALANHPETAENILFDMPDATDKCNGCGDCVDMCPTKAIDLVDGKVQILSTHCVSCGLCIDVCIHDGLEWKEFDGKRLIVDDPEAQKKIEEAENEKKRHDEQVEKSKKMGKKALDFLESQAEDDD